MNDAVQVQLEMASFFLQYAVQSLSEQQLMAYTPPRARRPNFMLVNEQDVKKRFPSFPFFQLKKNSCKVHLGFKEVQVYFILVHF